MTQETNKTILQIRPMFPVVVGVLNLGRKFTDKEMNFINNVVFTENTGNFVSTDFNVLDRDEMKDLKKFCHDGINDYFREIYKPINNLELRITQSWLNLTRKGQFHHRHTHSNSAFSASFYISSSDNDCIYFNSPHNQMLNFETYEYTDFNSRSWQMPAKEGNLLMFPSWLEHEVKTKEDDGDRVSLSFNTFYVGTIGLNNTLNELHLT